MSKIDKLGGYKNAKEAYEFLNSCRWHRTPEPDIDALGAELLAYRRAHNIFEVEDKVVFDAHFCDEHKGSGYGEITYCTMDKRVFEIDNYYLVSIDEIRHATDEDIAAGYRGAK